MPVRVCTDCKRFLVGERSGRGPNACPFCPGQLRSATPGEVLEFIEGLKAGIRQYEQERQNDAAPGREATAAGEPPEK